MNLSRKGAVLVGLVTSAAVILTQYGETVLTAPWLLSSKTPQEIVGALAAAPWVLPATMLILGGVAGILANRTWEAARTWRGAHIGARVGVGAIIGAVIACAALLAALGSEPPIQELVRASEPHPEARIPAAWIPWAAAGAGALLGLVVGLESMAAAVVGGLLADLLPVRGAQASRQSVQ